MEGFAMGLGQGIADAGPRGGGAQCAEKARAVAQMESEQRRMQVSPPRPVGNVTDQAARVAGNLDALANAIIRLEERLEGVLVAYPATPKSGAEIAPTAPSQLAQALAMFDERVNAACARIHSITDRIDL